MIGWVMLEVNQSIKVGLFSTLINIYENPQFRSIIPCEVLLYIEVTFLGFIH